MCQSELRRFSPGPVSDFTACRQDKGTDVMFRTISWIDLKLSLKTRSYFKLDARLGNSPERIGLPIDLLHLFPHHHVETGAVLIAKDEACVVIICFSIHVKRPFKVHAIECGVAYARNQKLMSLRSVLIAHPLCCFLLS